MDHKSIKIEIYIPGDHIPGLRKEFQRLGIGTLGAYDSCMSISNVTGSWRPLEGSSPYQGKVGEVEYGEECKVEVTCKKEQMEKAINAVKKIHPYDEPLINVIPLLHPIY